MADNYKTYNDYLQRQREIELANAQTIDYNPASPSALKSALAKVMRPDYDKAIANRQKTAAKNRAAIDSDAAARGMGSSTWVTDVKNRQNDAAATDIARIEDDYISSLYGNLLSKLGEQESRKLSVDQFNASAKQNALSQALQTANGMYGTWQAEQAKGSGRGGSPNPQPDEDYAAYLAWLQAQRAARAGVGGVTSRAKTAPGAVQKVSPRVDLTR